MASFPACSGRFDLPQMMDVLPAGGWTTHPQVDSRYICRGVLPEKTPLRRGRISSNRRSMQPPARTNRLKCRRWTTPLRAKAEDWRALNRTPTEARVRPAVQAGPAGVSSTGNAQNPAVQQLTKKKEPLMRRQACSDAYARMWLGRRLAHSQTIHSGAPGRDVGPGAARPRRGHKPIGTMGGGDVIHEGLGDVRRHAHTLCH